MYTILDCYTDEPAGLGVPPYLGTYPRYIAGALKKYYYITIDDLRLYKHFNSKIPRTKKYEKTNIKIYNLTKNYKNINKILKKTKTLIIILGIHTPGKYLSAVPGTINEVTKLTKNINCKKIVTGPITYGTQLYGGKFVKKITDEFELKPNFLEINNYKKIDPDPNILKQIPSLRIIEIETSHGCIRKKGCSFCIEPIKHKLEFREAKEILREIKSLYKLGARYFRLGKQSCFYCYPKIQILKAIRKSCKKIKTLHIDNVNPVMVINKRGIKITKEIVKYCTPGNVAAFGVESFDEKVIKQNNLNTTPEQVLKAVKIINKYGSKKGYNGMPKFLPGINLLFGLKGETKKTFEENYLYLKKILDQNLLIRRINIRSVIIFPNTDLFKTGIKFLKKNKKYYWKARNKIRKNIDFKMLKKIIPKNTILKEVRTEIHYGNKTFARQLGTYPLIVGINKRLELNKFYNIKITNHMLRSVVGEITNKFKKSKS